MTKTKIEISPLSSTESMVGDLNLQQMRMLLDSLYVMRRPPTEKNVLEWRENFLEMSSL